MSDLLESLSYSEAKQQLQKIVEDLEQGDIDIDKLEGMITRARDLVAFCQERLQRIEQRLKDVDDHSSNERSS